MAWPNSPLTSYLSGGLPAIKAFDLNAFQAAINGIINATYSLLGVVIDGTGGNVVTPVAGALVLSGTASAAGAGPAVPWGTIYREGAVFGSAAVDSAGAIVASYNAKSIAARAAGDPYVITFNGCPTNIDRCTGQVTGRFNAVARIPELNTLAKVGADLVATVLIYDTAGAAADGRFDLHVYGG